MPRDPRADRGRRRFTPTCVGNAIWPCSGSLASSVHPHVCGECKPLALAIEANGGSPPRVWGMPEQGDPRAVGHRFTPTCVGNA